MKKSPGKRNSVVAFSSLHLGSLSYRSRRKPACRAKPLFPLRKRAHTPPQLSFELNGDSSVNSNPGQSRPLQSALVENGNDVSKKQSRKRSRGRKDDSKVRYPGCSFTSYDQLSCSSSHSPFLLLTPCTRPDPQRAASHLACLQPEQNPLPRIRRRAGLYLSWNRPRALIGSC